MVPLVIKIILITIMIINNKVGPQIVLYVLKQQSLCHMHMTIWTAGCKPSFYSEQVSISSNNKTDLNVTYFMAFSYM